MDEVNVDQAAFRRQGARPRAGPARLHRHGEAVRLDEALLPAAPVRRQRVLKDVVAEALRVRRLQEDGPRREAPRRHVAPAQPADAAEKGEGDGDTAVPRQRLIFGQAAVGEQQAAMAVAHVHERFLRIGAHGLLGPASHPPRGSLSGGSRRRNAARRGRRRSGYRRGSARAGGGRATGCPPPSRNSTRRTPG